MTRLVSLIQPSHIDYGIKARGWRAFVNDHVARERAWFDAAGLEPRWLIHNPGFTPVPGVMQFGQWLQPDKRLRELRAEFAKAWKAVAKWGGRHTVYLGVFRWLGDPSYNPHGYEDARLGPIIRAGDWGRALNLTVEAIRPALDSGADFALDTGGQFYEGHPGFALGQLLESFGRRVYYEPFALIWTKGADAHRFRHLYGKPKIGVEESLRAENFPKYDAAFGTDDERVCLLNTYATTREAEVARVRRILARGPNYTAGLRVCGHGSVRGAADLGVTAGDLVAAVRDAAAAGGGE